MKITEQELKSRKSKIIACAFSMFCAQGIAKTSVRELAKAADVGVNSIFRYFSSKTQLLFKIQQLLWKKVENDLLTLAQQTPFREKCGYDQLSDLFDGFIALYEEHSAFLIFMCDYKVYLIREGGSLSVKDYQAMIKPIRALFMNAIRRGIRDGSISAGLDADDVFNSIWAILRSFMDGQILAAKALSGAPSPFDHFGVLKRMVLESLTGENAAAIFSSST